MTLHNTHRTDGVAANDSDADRSFGFGRARLRDGAAPSTME